MPAEWDLNAERRYSQIENGLDLTFSRVFLPYFECLVRNLQPRSILEVGGGTGHLAKSLSSIVKQYVMLEPSRGMFQLAERVLVGTGAHLHCSTLEAFSDEQQFDLVISHMCVQTVENFDAFITAIAKKLDSRGLFCISLPHPAFYNAYKQFFSPEHFCYAREQSATVSFTITLDPQKSIRNVPYFHRPISSYISAFTRAGLAVTALREVFPPRKIQALYGKDWENPRYLIAEGVRMASVRIPSELCKDLLAPNC